MSEVDALQGCLAAEHAAVFGYAALGGALAGIPDTVAEEALAQRAYTAHRDLRDALDAMVAELGAEPVAAEAAYRTGPTETAADCRRLAVTLEDATAAVYAFAVSQTTDETRGLMTDALTDAAVRAVEWGGRPDPFPGLG
jgi:hypothetical protein